MPHQLIRFLAVVVFLVATGLLAGWVWEAVWDAPTGMVRDGKWYPVPGETGLRADFSGTALFVLIGLLTGLLAGAVIALLARGGELLTLAAVVVGSGLAAVTMARVGAGLGPSDPREAAVTLDDGARLLGNLEVTGLSPYGALPFGALLALAVVFFLTAGWGSDEESGPPLSDARSEQSPRP